MNRSHHHEKAFIELYNEYSDDIFRFCFIRLRNRDKALDATQEVFFKMWNEVVKNPKKLQELDSPKAFLFRIARNTVIDATRKKTSTPLSWLRSSDDDSRHSTLEPIEIAENNPNPEEQLVNTELLDHLELLDPHHREILVFRFLHDMSVIDIAAMLQISENAASVRIHRALDHARKKLQHLYE
jgi:RNA polymerase sigma-70 factor (ECF subfamily)